MSLSILVDMNLSVEWSNRSGRRYSVKGHEMARLPTRASLAAVARRGSNGTGARFAGADADDIGQIGDENLAVAHLAGLGGAQNRLERCL